MSCHFVTLWKVLFIWESAAIHTFNNTSIIGLRRRHNWVKEKRKVSHCIFVPYDDKPCGVIVILFFMKQYRYWSELCQGTWLGPDTFSYNMVLSSEETRPTGSVRLECNEVGSEGDCSWAAGCVSETSLRTVRHPHLAFSRRFPGSCLRLVVNTRQEKDANKSYGISTGLRPYNTLCPKLVN